MECVSAREYLDIVSEAPLTYSGAKKLQLKRIDHIHVKRTNKPLPFETIGPTDRFMFGVRWVFLRGGIALTTIDASYTIPGKPTQTSIPILTVDHVTGTTSPTKRNTNLLWDAQPYSTDTSTAVTDWLWPIVKDDPWP